MTNRLRAESEDRKSRLEGLFKHHEAEVKRLKAKLTAAEKRCLACYRIDECE
jgi:hypothetical protein